MKSLYRKLGLLSVVLMGLSFSACDDAKYKPVDTGLYLAETSTKSLERKSFQKMMDIIILQLLHV